MTLHLLRGQRLLERFGVAVLLGKRRFELGNPDMEGHRIVAVFGH
jgi:hypothetical protein